jgi:hypothetical protein
LDTAARQNRERTGTDLAQHSVDVAQTKIHAHAIYVYGRHNMQFKFEMVFASLYESNFGKYKTQGLKNNDQSFRMSMQILI